MTPTAVQMWVEENGAAALWRDTKTSCKWLLWTPWVERLDTNKTWAERMSKSGSSRPCSVVFCLRLKLFEILDVHQLTCTRVARKWVCWACWPSHALPRQITGRKIVGGALHQRYGSELLGAMGITQVFWRFLAIRNSLYMLPIQ